MTRLRLRPPSPLAGLGTLLGPDLGAAAQSAVALLVALAGALVAGLALGHVTDLFDRLPGLLLLVPAVIAGRGAIFGTLGSRLGTAIHTGQFHLSPRVATVVGQNVVAVGVLSLSTSMVIGVVAKIVGVMFGVRPLIGVDDLIVLSSLAGISSAVLMVVFTLAVAAGSVRRGWDMDNVTAPLVTAVSDMVTLPLLLAATVVADRGATTGVLAVLLTVASVVVTIIAIRSSLELVKTILIQSMPVLVIGGLVSLVAGLTIERRIEEFSALPALLVFVPPFLASGGALTGILTSRLGSKLHLGIIEPSTVPGVEATRDIRFVFVLAVPLFTLCALLTDLVATWSNLAAPPLGDLVRVALLASLMAITIAVVVSYYGSIAAYRAGIDPDNVGIPLVTAAMDLAGAAAIVVAIAAFGVA
ncbi:MAG TPA: magnesium transporter [Acidimicrobiales bacterium]